MEKITLTLQLVNQVMAYLGSKPYQETFQLINAIQEEAKNQNTVQEDTPINAESKVN